jgi:hypothetical protein
VLVNLLPDVPIAMRGKYFDTLYIPLQSLLCFSKAFVRLSSCTTSVLQATIKGWWWLSKRTTTLWDCSG